MYLVLMMNTFYKNAVQPWAPDWRHATPIFSWLKYMITFCMAIYTNLLLIADILTTSLQSRLTVWIL